MISAVSQCSDRLICAALSRRLLARRLHAAHDELEVREVVALVLADHQEVALAVGAAVQAVRAVEHEDLEGGDAVLLDQLGNLADVPCRPSARGGKP